MAELVIKLANGEDAGKSIQEITKRVNAAALAMNKAEINSEEFFKAQAKFKELKEVQEGIKKQINGTTEANKQLKQSFLDIVPFGGQLKGMIGQFTGLKSGVGGLISSMGLLKTALISTGLGAIVVLLGSLFAWFQRTERGADFLAKAMAVLGAAVDVLTDRAAKLIDVLILFAQGKWSEGADKFAEATSGVTEEIIKESIAAWELADALDAIEEKEGQMILTRARAKSQIAELRLLGKDETLSMKERAAALEQAIELTRKLYDQEEQLARQKAITALGFTKEEEILKQYGKTLDELLEQGEGVITAENLGLSESVQEDVTKAFQALADLLEARKTSADEERAIVTELNTLKRKDRKADEEDVKRAAEARKKAEKEALDAQKKYWDDYYKSLKDLEDKKIQAMEPSRERDLAQLKLNLQRQIEAMDQNAPFYAERMAAAQELARQQRDKINKDWDDQEKQDAEAHSEELLELQLATDQNNLLQRFLAREITAQQYADLSKQSELKYHKDQLEIIKKAFGEQSVEYQRAYAEFLRLQADYESKSKTWAELSWEERAKTVADGLGVTAGFMGSMAGLYEQGSKQYKDFAVAQARISSIQGAINAYTSALNIPVIGFALAPIAAAAALAAGEAQVRRIRAQEQPSPVKGDLPKLESGGAIYGPRHSGGGVMVNAEGGEFMLSRATTNALGVGYLTRLNDHFTRKMETGGPIDPFTTSGRSGGSAAMMPDLESYFQRLEKSTDAKIEALKQSFDGRIDRIQVINDVTKTQEGIHTVNRIKDEADV